MQEQVSLVIFEGISSASPVETELASVRTAALLDNLDKFNRVAGIGDIYLGTNNRRLAELARGEGVKVVLNQLPPSKFHFGAEFKRLVLEHRLSKVFYLSGAGCPLIKEEEIGAICRRLSNRHSLLYANNIQSADLVAFTVSEDFYRVELPAMDNALATALRDQTGLKLELMPLSPGLLFDLDTPIDGLVLGESPSAGPRTRDMFARLDWDCARLRQAKKALGGYCPEVALIGRVGAPAIKCLNSSLRVRLRVFSEERGMKALGRVEAGQVLSLMGYLIDQAGLPKFFDYLSRIVQVAFIDTRVLMAHYRCRLSERERFLSDLGRYEEIAHPWLKELTRAAVCSPIPVILGGHTLVSGSLWVIAEELSSGDSLV